MNRSHLISIVAAACLLEGCSPSVMTLSTAEAERIEPSGLFVVASSQILDNDDSTHKEFTVRTASEFIPAVFAEQGFHMKPLNRFIKPEDVFTKTFVSFSIDEDKIANIARQQGCSTVLIVYYAYTGKVTTLGTGLNVYGSCSLYGWLVDTKDSSMISSSHTALNSLNQFLKNAPVDLQSRPAGEIYREFLRSMAYNMFAGIPRRLSTQ
jgi:hypothetical protein